MEVQNTKQCIVSTYCPNFVPFNAKTMLNYIDNVVSASHPKLPLGGLHRALVEGQFYFSLNVSGWFLIFSSSNCLSSLSQFMKKYFWNLKQKRQKNTSEILHFFQMFKNTILSCFGQILAYFNVFLGERGGAL